MYAELFGEIVKMIMLDDDFEFFLMWSVSV